MLRGFFEALDRGDVRWALLRPRETVWLPEGDIDVLTDPADRTRVREILEASGFVRMPLAGDDLHAVAYDQREGRFLWIHVQTELRVTGAAIPARSVLAEADAAGLPQPGDAWLLWILLLRALVDKGGELPDRHRPHVVALAERWSGGPPELESLARRHGLDPAEVVAAAAAADWDGLLGLAIPRRPPRASLRARLSGLREFRRPRGLSVAVIGPDGAGKSTLVQELSRTLPLPVRVQYMGLTGGSLPKADALRVPGLVFLARVFILWVRYLRGAYRRARGGIVLFERYTLDGAVPSGMPLSAPARLSRRLQRHVCPLPDLVLLLDASGETLYARSAEYRSETLQSWREAYDRLQASVPQLEVIDAEQPAKSVRREAERLIWRRYVESRGGDSSRNR